MEAVIEAQVIQFLAFRLKKEIEIPSALLQRLVGSGPRHLPRQIGRTESCHAFPDGIVDDSAKARCNCCGEMTAFVFEYANLPFCVRCCELAAKGENMSDKYWVVEDRFIGKTFDGRPSVFKSEEEARNLIKELKKDFSGQSYSVVIIPSTVEGK